MSNRDELRRVKMTLESEARSTEELPEDRQTSAVAARVLGRILGGEKADTAKKAEMHVLTDQQSRSVVNDMINDLMEDYPL